MRREVDWCPTCKVYHDDWRKEKGRSEADSGWRLVQAVPDVRDVDRAVSDRTPWASKEIDDIEKALARQWRVPGLALGGSDRERAS